MVGGDYRFVRNPMYVGVVTAILGQALLFLDLWLLVYGVIAWAVMASFVRWYEEPVLRQRYGRQYEEYCRTVPAWLPGAGLRSDLDRSSAGSVQACKVARLIVCSECKFVPSLVG